MSPRNWLGVWNGKAEGIQKTSSIGPLTSSASVRLRMVVLSMSGCTELSLRDVREGSW